MERVNHPITTDLPISEVTAVVNPLITDYKIAVLAIPQLAEGAARAFIHGSIDAEGHIGSDRYQFRAGYYGRLFSLRIEHDSIPGQFRGWDVEVDIHLGSGDERDPIKESNISYRSDEVYMTPYPDSPETRWSQVNTAIALEKIREQLEELKRLQASPTTPSPSI